VPNLLPSFPLGLGLLSQLSAIRSRRSFDKTLFIRTHVATYFISLLICNLDQAIGGLLNIPWVVAGRVYSGVACTAQGLIKQFGNVRGPLSPTVKGEHSHSSGWNSNFLFCDCRPYLQSTLLSSPVVEPHMLHRPRCIMGSPATGVVR